MSGVWKVYLSEADMIVKVHAHITGIAKVVLFHHDVGHIYSGGTILYPNPCRAQLLISPTLYCSFRHPCLILCL